MTTKGIFSSVEWKAVLEGPPSAGMIMVTAARGGMFRESIAMSKAYAEARAQHGESELLDEIVAAKPEMDHTRYRSAEELRDNGLEHLRDAVALVESKATTEELDGYRRFVMSLASKVAAAHREAGQSVSPAEAAAIQQIAAALGTTGPGGRPKTHGRHELADTGVQAMACRGLKTIPNAPTARMQVRGSQRQTWQSWARVPDVP